MQEVFIVSAVRTPLGSFGGAFANIQATQLGATAIKGALAKANLDPALVQEVIFGNVNSAGLGQAPARQAALWAGLSNSVACTTINKLCASGMKAVMLGAQTIMMGDNDIVVAGGMENMSMVPYYIPKGRYGYRYGHGEMLDGLVLDLTDKYHGLPMGAFADRTAEKYGFTREDQDRFAIQSYTRSRQATEAGKFAGEIVGVEVSSKKGTIMITEDEEYKNVNFDKIPSLRAVFSKGGTVTAANASTINDGAAAVILVSGKKVKELGLTPIARIVSFADGAHEPEWFTTAPTIAAPIALKKAGLSINDIDFFEVNEAFSVVTMAFNKVMGVDESKCNIHGGAVSLGHPLGASGARIIATLNGVLQQNDARYGMAAICNGGGGASSIIIEKV
jgi:acetyl-CoA C-acetyltransferase